MIRELLATILSLPGGSLPDNGANAQEHRAKGWRERDWLLLVHVAVVEPSYLCTS